MQDLDQLLQQIYVICYQELNIDSARGRRFALPCREYNESLDKGREPLTLSSATYTSAAQAG